MKITVDGQQVDVVKLDRLTLGEASALERVLHEPYKRIQEMAREGYAQALQGLYWVSIRRVRPEVTWAQMDSMIIGGFGEELDEEEQAAVAQAQARARGEGAGDPPAGAGQEPAAAAPSAPSAPSTSPTSPTSSASAPGRPTSSTSTTS